MVKSWQHSARGTALLVLGAVFDEEAYSNLALNKTLSGSVLTKQDKALVTELVYGTLARKITLEWYLAHYIEDRDKLDSWVYHLLLVSLYQLIYLDRLPAHAVVNEAVQLAKAKRTHAERYVNAILRKVVRSSLPDIQSIQRLNKRYSIQYSLPVWLIKVLIEDYGEKRALAIFESLAQRNKASVRVTRPDQLREIAEATGSEQSLLSPVGLTKNSGHFASSDYFKEGLITIQDETSQLVAPVMGLEGHERVLDACAAPGGKTVHLASYLTSGQITALDLYEHKLALIRENALRLGVSEKIETKQWDARKAHDLFGADHFDKILVDAPCSGIGLIRRKPDMRYKKELSDFQSLQKIQLEILDSVCQTVKKGGIITYSTCTIVHHENFQVIQQFLASHPEFEQVMLEHPQRDIMVDGFLLVTPELYMTDGFFIAQVRRKF
ncbi:16S rRNA (cytosine(967)-C(5))-methyltransferase RsmB [Streptococcus rifensis]